MGAVPDPGLTGWCRRRCRPLLLPVARALHRLGVTPNGVSLLGLAGCAAAAAVLALGHPAAAALVLLFLGPLDAVDGILAREFGGATRFGAFLDSTLDRYGEFCLFLGLLAYLWRRPGAGLPEAALVLAALTGSLLVSYTRARAEGLGFECRVGLATRFERLLLFGAALLTGWILPLVGLIAVLAHATALQRILHVRRLAR
ncbi:CDP-alcohol phosphatidyltransferase family protein [Dissulfurirhabdus thermomarina]|uniref:CDP-alcohol phosphatidyltransferase family protein n=1 Tax=Dissulfurirhabdus thermomarina TaxID=1765737 RepID=A0A6N9TNU5_DISTH|nr:CDP-alcohol phosphatidyltransferase family protein [Dissulfurirhabdus thermomarina]NDY42728.1 CDP-alcohol phosphatidyltransferase family protein [Dissulfurirhabdus thermomarina]NMX22565.1 CDP-alcohol phosphatidyltransferase family protein [Dissulfurirhabdus thermomarina]